MNDQNFTGQDQNYQQPGYNQSQPGYNITPKSLPLYIILSLVTCGIFEFYWLYTANEDITLLTRKPERMSGAMVVLLSIVTCGIFLWYWMYQQGVELDEYKTRLGIPSNNSGVLYLILAIISGGLIPLALIQNEINQIVTGKYGRIF